MKRHSYLYNNIYKFSNIKLAYKEVCKNTHNKRRVSLLKDYEAVYIYRIYKTLLTKSYKPGPCNSFIIYEPKERLIVSQNIEDKIINHLVARNILYPAILPCLLDVNVASRKNMGTSKGLQIEKKYATACRQKYGTYYILKCDISKFFASINHTQLKKKVQRRIKDPDALKIVFDIIDSNPSRAIYRINDKSNFSYFLLK